MTDYKIRLGSEVASRLRANPRAFKFPSNQLDIFVVRDFLTPVRLRPADPADRRQPRPLDIALADPRPGLPHQRELQPRSRRADRRAGRGEDHRPDGHRSGKGRDRPGPALRGRPAVQAAPRFLPRRRALLAGDGTVRRPAHLDGDGLPQRAGRAAATPSSSRPASRSRPAPATCSPGTISTRSASPTPPSLHQGMPVAAGVKYIITKWYRERRWLPSDMQTY